MDDNTPVMSATLHSMIVLATKLAYLSRFSCSRGSPLFTTGPPKETQSRKSLKASILVVSLRMVRRTSTLEAVTPRAPASTWSRITATSPCQDDGKAGRS
jgi:hypothetical protein